MINPLRAVRKWFRDASSPFDGEQRPDPTADFWYNLINTPVQFGGQIVNPDTACKLATAYACTQAIAETVAMIPVGIFKQIDYRTTEYQPGHYLRPILTRKTNGYMNPFEFWEMMVITLYNYGNACAVKEKTKSGRIYALTPLQASLLSIKQDPITGRVVYTYRHTDGTPAEVFDQDDVFHLKFRTADGVKGRSPIDIAAGTFGFGLALEEYTNKVFTNGAFLSGFLKSPFAFETDEARDNFMDSFKRYTGVANSGKFGLLEQGVDYAPFQQNNQEAQLEALHRLSDIKIMKIYRMPPPLVQEIERGSSYATVEQLAIAFRQYTIAPVVSRIEFSADMQLLMENEGDLNIKFNLDALERGDLKSRTESLVSQLQYGLKTVNEGRHSLGDNPIEDPKGDEVMVSHNLIPISMVGEVATGAPPTQVQVETPPFDPENDPDDQPGEKKPPPDDSEEENSVLSKIRPVFKATLSRMNDIEARAVQRAIKKEGFGKWAEDFYPKHIELMRESLRPEFSMAADLIGQKDAELRLNKFLDFFLNHRRGLLAENLMDKVATGQTEPDVDYAGSLIFHLTEFSHARN